MSNADESTQRLHMLCGEALFWAQLLEQEILNSILLHAIARKKVTTLDEARNLLSKADKQPLRRKLDEIFKRVKTEPDLSPTFFEAVEKRNFFIHKFFWDRFDDLHMEEGRQRLIVEVREYVELFRSAYLWSQGIAALYMKQTDVTEAMVREELEHLIPNKLSE